MDVLAQENPTRSSPSLPRFRRRDALVAAAVSSRANVMVFATPSIPWLLGADHPHALAAGERGQPGRVISAAPFARVVQIDDYTADHGRVWIVQATFLAAPQRDADWWTIDRVCSRDGRVGNRGRKVYPHLVKLPASARAEARRAMVNASKCCSVVVPLFVEARSLLIDHDGGPPFPKVRELIIRARREEAALRNDMRAGKRYSTTRHAYDCVPNIAERVLDLLLRPETIEVPVATDGVCIGRFADFNFIQPATANGLRRSGLGQEVPS